VELKDGQLRRKATVTPIRITNEHLIKNNEKNINNYRSLLSHSPRRTEEI